MPGDNRSSERFLYTINRTFNLPDWKWVVTSYSKPSTIPVYGNGIALGFYNGNGRFAVLSGSTYSAGFTNRYGAAVGTSVNGAYWEGPCYGVTTDASKSGLVGGLSDLTFSTLNSNIKFYIKY